MKEETTLLELHRIRPRTIGATWGPAWLNPDANETATPLETKAETVESEPIKPAPNFSKAEHPDDDATEFYFSQLTDRDFAYLTGPRSYPQPCPWCGGRYRHSDPCQAMRDAAEPIFTFGKHKGRCVSQTPIDYLQWALSSCDRLDNETREAIQRRLTR